MHWFSLSNRKKLPFHWNKLFSYQAQKTYFVFQKIWKRQFIFFLFNFGLVKATLRLTFFRKRFFKFVLATDTRFGALSVYDCYFFTLSHEGCHSFESKRPIQVLRAPESWSKHFLGPFSTFFVNFKHFSPKIKKIFLNIFTDFWWKLTEKCLIRRKKVENGWKKCFNQLLD